MTRDTIAHLTEEKTLARLLVVHHSPSRSLRALRDAAVEGAANEEIPDVEVVVREALDAAADDVLAADGYLLGTSANFGYMSGALKHFFDRNFLAIGGALDDSGAASEQPSGATAKRPWGYWVHGRYDTTGAVRSVQSIVGALGWRQAHAGVDVLGEVTDEHLEQAWELGATVAAVISDSAH
ncbi:flavodoxin family protein [Nocardioides daejeonensis]|uniref:flavodoxin family protein n=1 Tax=Nocardioides daejeonensis TaxID=1046556 RepID=UPI001EF746A7|nr:flavodoxin family protein [Nocardioides daejeonensis]